MSMPSFKEFITEFNNDESMVVDPEFVAKNPRLQARAALMKTDPDQFQKVYKREVMRDANQRRKQQMMKKAGNRVQSTGSQQDQPNTTGIEADRPGTSAGGSTNGGATGMTRSTRGMP